MRRGPEALPVMLARRAGTGSGESPLVIYIEGDGRAWKNRRTPSADPTPGRALALELAIASPPHFDTAYIGRPCQFEVRRSDNCQVAMWTGARYSSAVVESIDDAIDSLKSRRGQTVILVGYSGGGVIAALLGARRDDLTVLITVAANLDIAAWTTLLQVTPLNASLNPVNYAQALARVPQRHLVAGADKVVPIAVSRSYLQAVGLDEERHLLVFADYDHRCCWVDNWSAYFNDVLGSLGVPDLPVQSRR